MTNRFPFDLPAGARPVVAPQGRSCGRCMHRLRRGTCAEPVAAGLAESFGIFWAPAGHAERCTAFVDRDTQMSRDMANVTFVASKEI